jgi:predicted anti-sigma-YlaC factor YlaD
MRCAKTRKALNAHVDGELAPVEARGVEAHLADCGSCREYRAALARVGSLLDEVAVPPPPAGLAAVVSARAREQAERRSEPQRLHPGSGWAVRWLVPQVLPMRLATALVAALATLAGLALGTSVSERRQPRGQLAQSVGVEAVEWFGAAPPGSVVGAYVDVIEVTR